MQYHELFLNSLKHFGAIMRRLLVQIVVGVFLSLLSPNRHFVIQFGGSPTNQLLNYAWPDRKHYPLSIVKV